MKWAIAPLCRSVFLISCCDQLESTTPPRTSTTSSPPFWLKLFVILVLLFFGGSAATTPSSTSILCGWWRTLNPAGRISCSFFSASLRVHSLSSRLYLSSCITQRSWEISPPSSSSPWRFIKFLWILQRYTTCGPAGARTAATRNEGPLEGQEESTQRFCCEGPQTHRGRSTLHLLEHPYNTTRQLSRRSSRTMVDGQYQRVGGPLAQYSAAMRRLHFNVEYPHLRD